MKCRLCGGETVPLFEKMVLRKHKVGYHQCTVCGLTQTDEPTWLKDAYVDAIHPTDTGVLARNLGARRVVATFLHLSGVRGEPCLDYAGGYGIFTRLMRDVGFEYFWMDPYATNTLARGFEWSPGPAAPRAVTAFEVLEHLVRPLEEFKKIAALGAEWILTSTELHPGSKPAPDWHYLSVESGQHVAFYRWDTLERLGREAGYPHVTAGPFFQIFARKPFPAWKWQTAIRLGALAFPIVKKLRPSLTVSDCESIRSRLRGE
jgi:hypothetical protein